ESLPTHSKSSPKDCGLHPFSYEYYLYVFVINSASILGSNSHPHCNIQAAGYVGLTKFSTHCINYAQDSYQLSVHFVANSPTRQFSWSDGIYYETPTHDVSISSDPFHIIFDEFSIKSTFLNGTWDKIRIEGPFEE